MNNAIVFADKYALKFQRKGQFYARKQAYIILEEVALKRFVIGNNSLFSQFLFILSDIRRTDNPFILET